MLTRASSRVAVIGAGLAGAAAARAVARAGLEVHVFEAKGLAAQGASGNPIGIYHPLISRDYNLASQLIDCGIAKALSWISELIADGRVKDPACLHHACGVLQIAKTEEESLAWQKVISQFEFKPDWLRYLTAIECAEKSYGVNCSVDHEKDFPYGGLLSNTSGWISPPAFVDAMLADAKAHSAQISVGEAVAAISEEGAVSFESGSTQHFDHVVVCSGHLIEQFFQDAHLGITPIAGNLDIYDLSHGTGIEDLKHITPSTILCLDGYLTPIVNRAITVGATFDRPDSQDPISNQTRLQGIAPRLAKALKNVDPSVRRSYRSATIDRMPHIGQVLDCKKVLSASISQLHQMPRAQKLWVMGGFGSRGLSLAPLAAEVLIALIKGQKPSLDQALLRAVDPVRFALRHHQRNPATGG